RWYRKPPETTRSAPTEPLQPLSACARKPPTRPPRPSALTSGQRKPRTRPRERRHRRKNLSAPRAVLAPEGDGRLKDPLSGRRGEATRGEGSVEVYRAGRRTDPKNMDLAGSPYGS